MSAPKHAAVSRSCRAAVVAGAAVLALLGTVGSAPADSTAKSPDPSATHSASQNSTHGASHDSTHGTHSPGADTSKAPPRRLPSPTAPVSTSDSAAAAVLPTATAPAETPTPQPGGGAPVDPNEDTTVPTPPTISDDEASSEAALVAAEDRRLIEVRAVTAVAPQHGAQWKSPYRLATGNGYTLILTPRAAPYTIADLLQLAPTTFLRTADGSYLLLENIYLSRGARLDLDSTDDAPLTLRMVSNASGFVSIVSYGGDLRITGTEKNPVVITSWDPRTSQPVTDVSHGRSYIRAIGGSFTMSYADVTDLGFWSGRTGGIGLTGTARAASGATGGPSIYKKGKGKGTKNGATAAQPPDSLGDSTVASGPAGALSDPQSEFAVPGLSYISVRVDHSLITGNAFGLFVSGATGILISDTRVTGSLTAGIVLHRFATQGVIQRVNSSRNDGDGIVIARAAQNIQIDDSVADYNAGNGITVNGQPISQGPSASGEPLGAYGNNQVDRCLAKGDGHYGILVLGGLNLTLQDNDVDGSQMGIVVRKGGQKIVIAGNTLKGQSREGISVRDGVQAVTISDNSISGAAAGIYVRASSAQITGNHVTGATIHGVTLVGDDAGSVVKGNTLSGRGPGAINSSRQTGAISIGTNATGGWFDTTALWVRVEALIRPLTVIWFCILTLVALTSLRGRRTMKGKAQRHIRRRARMGIGVHPYQGQAALPEHDLTVVKDNTAIPAEAALVMGS
ncbi:nitrous oxidase accessory protein NosD [Catenulispora sp. GP43]|uniref:right-handed parallel beta-helix repeat-containing protein n=1 Tax=Catenulispora sp. GP43 TaxID=3156263 RepID=UPI00351665F1